MSAFEPLTPEQYMALSNLEYTNFPEESIGSNVNQLIMAGIITMNMNHPVNLAYQLNLINKRREKHYCICKCTSDKRRKS